VHADRAQRLARPFWTTTPRRRRSLNNKSTRCGRKFLFRKKEIEQNQYADKKIQQRGEAEPVFHSVRRQSDYQGYRPGTPDQAGSSISGPILIGAAMIATALLLSTLITILGSRYIGFESSAEDSAWLVDRLTGSVYKCQTPGRGRAACDSDMATGSISQRPK
jgi:hypothetical protein